jgi:hypothetical protein
MYRAKEAELKREERRFGDMLKEEEALDTKPAAATPVPKKRKASVAVSAEQPTSGQPASLPPAVAPIVLYDDGDTSGSEF